VIAAGMYVALGVAPAGSWTCQSSIPEPRALDLPRETVRSIGSLILA